MSTARAHPLDSVVRAQHDALLGLALRLCRNEAEARDIVQDTFERALRNYERLPPGSNVRAWLFTILNNAFIDRCRSRAAAPKHDSVDLADVAVAEAEETEPSLSTKVTPEQFRSAVEELAPEYRVIYTKYAIDDLSYQAIADELAMPINTVATRIARARRKLRAILTEAVGVDGGDS